MTIALRCISVFSITLTTLACAAAGGLFADDDSSPTRPPKYEVRAVWLTTVAGLDWPKSTDRAEQQSSLREMIEQVERAHFNTIFFQVRGRADAMYRSRYEPWSSQLAGALGKDPGWDPLQFVLDEAHARGIEVHAWFNTFFVKAGPKPSESWPPHLILNHPDWVQQYKEEWWLDPGLPQVRTYLVNVAMDIVRNYDVDGIHFDFIRYPGPDYPDNATYRRYGKNKKREEWRRENINQFVRAVYDSVVAAKPWVKVGSTPIGVYVNIQNGSGWQSYHSLFQDSRAWLREKKHDYLVPQLYWTLGNRPGDPDFATLAKNWGENTYGRHIYIGIGAYKPEVFQQIPEQVDVSREAGALGNSYFRFEHISKRWEVGDRYRSRALIPPMPWKNAVPPNPPTVLSVTELGEGRFQIKWSMPQAAADGDRAKRIVIYRSLFHPVDIDNPWNIVGFVSGSETSFVDRIERPTSLRYYYAATSIDRCNNESLPANEAIAVVSEIEEIGKRLKPKTTLAECYPHPSKGITLVPYEIADPGPVWLKILDLGGRTLEVLVEAMQSPGRYVAAANTSTMKDGLYQLQLTAGSVTVSTPLEVRR